MTVFAAAHIGGMTALRMAIYPLFGSLYHASHDVPLLTRLVYEGRKDALSYLAMVLCAWILDAALQRRAAAVPPVLRPEPSADGQGNPVSRIEIRDGARRIWVDPAEVRSEEPTSE